jgi:hypothetical protein
MGPTMDGRQSAYSVISRGTILLGSSRRGENKEERYVRREFLKRPEDKQRSKGRVGEFQGGH